MTATGVRQLRFGATVLAGVSVAYLGFAVTAFELQPHPLDGIAVAVMAGAGVLGLVLAFRIFAGRPNRMAAVGAAVLLAVLALVPLAFGLFQWAAQREGFERARTDPGLSYAPPGPLLDVVLVPGLVIVAAGVAAVLLATSPSKTRSSSALGTDDDHDHSAATALDG